MVGGYRGNTTSDAAARSSGSSTKTPYVYVNPTTASGVELYRGRGGAVIVPPSGLQTTPVQKNQLPILSGKGKSARAAGYRSVVSTPYGPASTDPDYVYINKPISLKNAQGTSVKYAGYFVPKKQTENKTSSSTGGGTDGSTLATYLPPGKPDEYSWNLPPHKWSLPTLPTVVNKHHYTESTNSTTVTNPGSKKDTAPREPYSDKYRRGRLWWKANPDIEVIDKNKKATKISAGSDNRKFGFQFLWNPETFGTQVAVQMEATPNPQDRFLGVAGAFPATETISFTIRLDRTNDFACAAANLKRPTSVDRTNEIAANYVTTDAVSDYVKYYINNGSFNAGIGDTDTVKTKLVDLFQRGTIADIEYLYKAINGPGPSSKVFWTNGRGIKTADIGFLMPTLLHIDIGPLSYEGYVTNLSVTHLMFTPDMVPIRSDLTISLNLLATATLNRQA